MESLAQPETAAPSIVMSQRDQWLARRRELVTASDAAAILGMDPYRKPSDVFLEKLGLRDDEESWPMLYGQAFQDGVGRAYSHHTGRAVRMASLELPEIVVHPDIPWLGATLDGETAGSQKVPAPAAGDGVLEAKVSSIAHTWGEELPVTFQLQVTVQAACARKLWGAIAAFVSLRQAPRSQDVVFDRELFDLMVPKLEEFRQRVLRKDPPPDDPAWWSSEAIRRVFSTDSGAPIGLDAETLTLVEEWEDAKAEKKAAKNKVEALGDRLRLRMGTAPIGYLPDGTALTLKVTQATLIEAHTRAAHRKLLRTKPKGRK